jgi:hypothetical protein
LVELITGSARGHVTTAAIDAIAARGLLREKPPP